ncbi:MAG: cytochrome c biogenesis protein CcdA [Planctomycetota bacterium]
MNADRKSNRQEATGRESSAFIRGFMFWLLAASAAWGAEKANIEWALQDSTATAARGQTIKVILAGKFPTGWHTYSTKEYGEKGPPVFPTKITAAPESLVKINGGITYPKPETLKLEGFDVEIFEKTAAFTVPLQVARSAPPGEYKVTLAIDAQLCSESACVPFLGKTAGFTLKVTEAVAARTQPPVPEKLTGAAWFGTRQEIEGARQRGLLAYLGFSTGMGAAALLTPCVFPMIPITVSFFIKRKHVSRRRALRDAALYALGIIAAFTALGFLFTLLLGATGITDFAANPWVNLLVAAVFTAFALNLLGAFELQLPGFIFNRLNVAARQGEGVVPVLLMGLVFSLTSFTCTVPFVGTSLFSATQGEWTWPLAGMCGFAAAFSAPFFVLALCPALLKALPKAGGWLNSVKVVMGFLELAAAMKFLSNADLVWHWGILKREVFVSVWIALALLTAIYILGRLRLPHETAVEHTSACRVLLAAGFLALGIWLSTGLFGQALGELEAYVPPRPYPGQQAGVELSWLEDWDSGLAEAKHSAKPLLVDFSGYTCTNCRWMETKMFPLPEVAALLKEFVRVRLYTDGRSNAEETARSHRNQALLQERYQTTALPFYAIVGPEGKDIATFPGLTRDVQLFTEFLESGVRGSGFGAGW